MSRIPQPDHVNRKPVVAAVLGGIVALSSAQAPAVGTTSSNPPAVKHPTLLLAAACNPCNPCAVKKSNPCNPGAAKAANPCNPCAAKAANPCNPGGATKLAAADFLRPAGVGAPATSAALVAKGKAMWNDTSLGKSGLACQSCHAGGAAFGASFAEPYPHQVAMPSQMSGVRAIHLDEMVQFCMVVPIQAKPLAWGSQELAALTAYSAEVQKGFNPCKASKTANPCAAKNPCNPCAAKKANPCNPCAAKNPCNPCAAKNPCKTS